MWFVKFVTAKLAMLFEFCKRNQHRNAKSELNRVNKYLGALARFIALCDVIFARVLMHRGRAICEVNNLLLEASRKVIESRLTFAIQRRFVAQGFIAVITVVRRSVACRYPLMGNLLAFIL